MVRAAFEAYNRGDLDALVEFYDPDVVFETAARRGPTMAARLIRLIYEENRKTLSGYDVDPMELIDAGDKVVAVAQAAGARSRQRDRASDEPVRAFVFTFASGKVVRVSQTFRNKDEALEAAGLSE